MKIAYFLNTFKSSNWGGQATSNGVKYLLSKEYPNAEFCPLDLPELRFKKIKLLRKWHEKKLTKALLDDDFKEVIKQLEKLNINEDIFDSYTHICFNGEGAIHYKSGHLIRLMGLLYLANLKNKKVASINQTVDLGDDKRLENLVSKVYNKCDFVSVREPISHKLAMKMGIKRCKLIPDGVYGLPMMSKDEIKSKIKKYELPDRYITLTGSSALKRDKKSLKLMSSVIKAIQKVHSDTLILFMASTKTDIFLAQNLKNRFGLRIIDSSNADYKEAMAIFANSMLLVGGRQHPNIFAYIYKVPYITLEGNTFKNSGVAKLQNYPIAPLSWNSDFDKIYNTIESIKQKDIEFTDIKINSFDIFEEER